MDIRPAVPADYERCREIEVRAGELFRSIGLDAVADDDPFSSRSWPPPTCSSPSSTAVSSPMP